jgi:hypothetical protein
MIPIEYYWITLIIVFGFVGAARGLNKELGVTTLLLLSLFVLKFTWETLGSKVVGIAGGRLPPDTVMALYYIVCISFVAFIAYEGFSLAFPVRSMKGLSKAFFGMLGGLLNGYLYIGTVWDASYQANYFGLKVPFGCCGTKMPIVSCLTDLHATLVQYLPITFIPAFVMLALGMILLLAIVLK